MKHLSGNHSFKRQIILTFVVGFLLLIAGFSVYTVRTERDFLYRDSAHTMASVAQSLAAGSVSWVLANDVAGLQEVVHSFQNHPELRYAMVVSLSGRVLAHSDPTKVGQFLSDPQSLAMIQSPPGIRTVQDSPSIIDVAAPIMVESRQLAWARIAQGREGIAGNLRQLAISSALFVLLAAVLSLLAAVLIANRLGARIESLVAVALAVKSGNFDTRADTTGRDDEITKLAVSLNQMLDARVRSEQALHAASLYTRSLIEASLDPLVTISPQGKVTDVNHATEAVTGRDRSELVGSDFSDYFTEPDKAREGYQRVFQEGSVIDYPLAIRHQDGHVTDVLYNASVYRDERGAVLGVFAAARDITERKLADASRKQLAAIVESSNDAIVGKTPDGIITHWNHGAETIYGYTAEEIIGQSVQVLAPPDMHGELHELLLKAREGETVVNCETVRVRKDGVLINIALTLSPIRDDMGKISGISAIARDITERRRAEEKIKESERKFRALTDTSPLAIYMSSGIEQKGEYINPRFVELFGYTLEEVPSVAQWWQLAYPDEEYRRRVEEEWRTKVERAIQTGSAIEPMEVVVHCKDGSRKTISWGYISMGVQNWAFGLDLTERKRVEEELRRYKDHLEDEVQQRTADLVLARNAAEAANKAKSVFLASMSHELRTPLNAILGFSSMMRKDEQLKEGQRQNLDIINRSGEHLLSLINDVLDMAKIESGRIQLEEAPFDLGSMVRDVTDMMQVRAKEKSLQLLIDQSSRFPRYIIGDEARLRQVLINLVGNAVKFTQQGGVTIRLGTRRNKLSHLRVEVEDSGPGIAAQDQQRIFEPFVQLDPQGTNKGTGLGLTITRQFVHLMGGKIELESVVGEGSLFRVELPLREANEADIVQSDLGTRGDVVGLVPGQPSYRILIVEDQRDNQLLLSRLLESVGFQVKIAENGEEGVRQFQNWHPHFIWMDRRMPVMDGLEATRRIRQLDGGRDVKIAAVTASAFSEQRAEMMDAGMDDFVRKPYRSNEIYECLAKHLGVRYEYRGIPAPSEAEVNLTSAMLATLPQDLRDTLRGALESLDEGRIDQAIQRVAPYDPALQKSLAQLAAGFNYPAILNVL